ncbi:M12 family metallopeptidase [Bradyrhizobium amphicarpaeae]|nr:M12 family metallopeptidase [Bradyrhizobium amphicarpaeae]
MKAVALACVLGLVATGPAATQPAPSPTPTITITPKPRPSTLRLLKVTAAIKNDALRRIDRGTVARNPGAPSMAATKLVDTRLGSAVAGFQQQFEQMRLRQAAANKQNPQFIGVIDSMKVGETEISLERRKVRTGRGVQNLLLTRFNGQYVYDGDLIVPWTAIETGNATTFSAGVAGTFGKGSLWDDAIIPFEVDSNFCCRDALADAIAFYEANTIFRFVPRDGHETYVRLVNAEPFTTSRSELGKAHGENIIRIQGTRLDGSPADSSSLSTTIQHEIGHELGLIHEHLRSDRDKFIARNPSCAVKDIFQGIYEGWIDVGQVAIVDDSAELLTGYDFDSLMHYSFGLDTNGDGFGDCSTWVRIATCPGRDPTSPRCNSTFSSFQLTRSDIEGLHKLYGRIPNDPDIRTFAGDNVRYRGRKVDHCLQGLPIGQNGCSAESRGAAADAFCRAKGFQHGVGITSESAWGEHSGYDVVVGWKNVWGTDVISSVTCEGRSSDPERVSSGDLEAQVFTGDEIKVGGRRVDRCVHGGGIVGDRCSEENQERIANRFCELKGFDRSSSESTDFAVEINATGFHPSTNDFRNVSSLDIFNEVTCVRRPRATAATSLTFSGANVVHRGKRIDRCLQGTSFGEDGCSAAAQRRVATEFCRVKGFRDASNIQLQGDVGEHSIFDKVVGWKNAWGTDVISAVTCENETEDAEAVRTNTLEERKFSGTRVKLSDRHIDRCVHGDGISGDRCSVVNQRRIANKFCELKEFDHATVFETDGSVDLNTTGFRPKTDDFQNVSSLDIFTQITCVRAPS